MPEYTGKVKSGTLRVGSHYFDTRERKYDMTEEKATSLRARYHGRLRLDKVQPAKQEKPKNENPQNPENPNPEGEGDQTQESTTEQPKTEEKPAEQPPQPPQQQPRQQRTNVPPKS